MGKSFLTWFTVANFALVKQKSDTFVKILIQTVLMIVKCLSLFDVAMTGSFEGSAEENFSSANPQNEAHDQPSVGTSEKNRAPQMLRIP